MSEEIDYQPLNLIHMIKVRFDGKTIKLRQDQVCAKLVAKVFCLLPDSVLLCTDDGEVECPDDEGRFNNLEPYLSYSVIGENIPDSPGPSAVGVNPLSYQHSFANFSSKGKSKWVPTAVSSLSTAHGRQKPPGVKLQEVTKTKAAGWRKNVDICKWFNPERKWKKVSNLPIILTEETAHVSSVSDIVSDDTFNGEAAVLLDVDH